jgi:hypothetical protein
VRSSIISPSRRTVTIRARPPDALIVEAIGDLLRLADDAEARRGDDGNTAVALVACGR